MSPSVSPCPPTRRRWLGAAVALAAGTASPGWMRPALAGPLSLTPSQAEGPFYPLRLPQDHDADLLRHGLLTTRHGEAAWLEGRVLDPDGRPVTGAAVEIWQCDHQGHYHHPGDGDRADPAFQGFGRALADAEGRYRFRTLRPVAYQGRTPHIHVKVRLDRHTLLTTQLYVEGEAGNLRDPLWRRLDEAGRQALTRPFQRGVDGWRANFPLVVQA